MRGVTKIATLLVTLAVIGLVAGCLAAIVQPFVTPIPSTPPPVDPARLEAHVKRLSVDFHPRRYDQMDNIARTVQYIADGLKASGAAVSTQDIEVRGRTYQNIIARFGPTTGPLLVIGAHYDSYGVTPGADDNASAANREVSLMVSLEMIGYFTDAPKSQRFPAPGLSLLYPEQGNFMTLVGKLSDFGVMRRVKSAMSGATHLPVHSINSPRRVPGIENSDHVNFWDANYPALMVTDTAYLRNPNYHGPNDTWQTFDYKRMAQVVRAVYAVTQQL